MAELPAKLNPADALSRLLDQVEAVGPETLTQPAPEVLPGRVLAAPVLLDRDSPACDVSAMDGYAVRIAELNTGSIPLVGECRIGEAPAALPPGAAMRIYTGSPLPEGADTVVRLERASAAEDRLSLLTEAAVTAGADIRHRGENARAGSQVLSSGLVLNAAAMGALATVGTRSVSVHRRIRVAAITTGNELDRGTGELPSWRLRDSNGPSLVAMLAPLGWVELVQHTHADDSLEGLVAAVSSASTNCDAVVLTGGVSKGAYDFVPEAIQQAGGRIVFHRIRARPGQPTLGAVAGGKPIVGLPGNPLSVLCASRRLLAPALRKRAGFTAVDPPAPLVSLNEPSTKTLPITWWRPVTLSATGRAILAPMKGSGDVIGPAMSDGFVEIPPEATGVGPYAYYPWAV